MMEARVKCVCVCVNVWEIINNQVCVHIKFQHAVRRNVCASSFIDVKILPRRAVFVLVCYVLCVQTLKSTMCLTYSTHGLVNTSQWIIIRKYLALCGAHIYDQIQQRHITSTEHRKYDHENYRHL